MAKKKASSGLIPPQDTTAAPRPRRAAPRRSPARTAGPADVDRTATAQLDRAEDSPVTTGLSASHAPSYEEIAEAAYHRFLKRGGLDGRDFDDWIEAERELRIARDRSAS